MGTLLKEEINTDKKIEICNNCKQLETQPMLAFRGMWKEDQYRCAITEEIIIHPDVKPINKCEYFENKWKV